MNPIPKILALLLIVVLIFIYPLSKELSQQDDLSYLLVHKATTEFVDAVRDKGYITPQMYEDFVQLIHKTGNLYDISLAHEQKRVVPVYTDPANPSTFQNRYETHYDGQYTSQILSVLFPNNTKPKNDESRKYKLYVGDYFNVVVKNINRTTGDYIRDFINLNHTDRHRIYIPYGGMVLNEDH